MVGISGVGKKKHLERRNITLIVLIALSATIRTYSIISLFKYFFGCLHNLFQIFLKGRFYIS